MEKIIEKQKDADYDLQFEKINEAIILLEEARLLGNSNFDIDSMLAVIYNKIGDNRSAVSVLSDMMSKYREG